MFGMNSTVPTLFIDASSGAGTWGNVGIGNITAPASLLHVRDQIRVGLSGTDNGSLVFNNAASQTITFNTPASMGTQSYTLPTATGSINDFLQLGASGQLQWASAGTVTGAWMLTGNGGTTAGTNFLGTTDAIDLVVKTTGTERMRVMAGGNVAIGTAAPQGRLHVRNPGSGSPTDLVIDRNGSAQANLRFNTGGTGQRARIGLDATGNHLYFDMLQGSADHIFRVNTSTEAMRIVGSNARVGIGTAMPNARLHVAGPTNQLTVAQFNTVGASADQHLTVGNYTPGGGSIFQGYLKGKTDQDNHHALVVMGELTDDADNGALAVMRFQTFKIASGSSAAVTRPSFEWRNGSSIHMRMLANGNVGIGTTSPSGRLHVAGTAFVNTLPPNGSGNRVGIGAGNQLTDWDASSVHFIDPTRVS